MPRLFWISALGLALMAVACDGSNSEPATDDEVDEPAVVAVTTPPTSAGQDQGNLSPDSASTGTTATEATTTPPTTVPVLEASDLDLGLERVGSFPQPVFLTSPLGDPRLFVVDQAGRIWISGADGAELFLDIRDRVAFGGEQGLLGLAFHPEYASNGLFYVNYTRRSGDTVIAEFTTGVDGLGDRESARTVLVVAQPAANHNGGMLRFGGDGFLWIGMGDGGASNDRFGFARDPDNLNGAMLRIVVGEGAAEPYGVPADNMFVADRGGRTEIWAMGLRNPWRWAFDEDRLFVADVGQGRIEEISVVSTTRSGLDFGWSILEGDECFQRSECDREGLVEPVYTYTHDDGCSITGGAVYRGLAIPELSGHYFFADFCAGWVRSIEVDESGSVLDEIEWDSLKVNNPTSFGVDAAGEIYVLSASGEVFQVVRVQNG